MSEAGSKREEEKERKVGGREREGEEELEREKARNWRKRGMGREGEHEIGTKNGNGR